MNKQPLPDELPHCKVIEARIYIECPCGYLTGYTAKGMAGYILCIKCHTRYAYDISTEVSIKKAEW